MNTVADFTPEPDENALLDLDRAHKAYELVQNELIEALNASQIKLYEDFNPVIFEAQSVLYEAMAKAAKAGFSYPDMAKTMQCDSH